MRKYEDTTIIVVEGQENILLYVLIRLMYWNSVPVIRAANLIDADTIIASYKGASYFESPLVN
jgi:hypothetical protein